jgi:hypothetical protein
MELAAAFAFLFLLFEIAQVILLERYIGIRTLKADIDPRELPLPTWVAVLWILCAKFYVLWMILLLFERALALPASVMLAATLAGLVARRAYGLRGALVILTFEVAIRVGMLLVTLRWAFLGTEP